MVEYSVLGYLLVAVAPEIASPCLKKLEVMSRSVESNNLNILAPDKRLKLSSIDIILA